MCGAEVRPRSVNWLEIRSPSLRAQQRLDHAGPPRLRAAAAPPALRARDRRPAAVASKLFDCLESAAQPAAASAEAPAHLVVQKVAESAE